MKIPKEHTYRMVKTLKLYLEECKQTDVSEFTVRVAEKNRSKQCYKTSNLMPKN